MAEQRRTQKVDGRRQGQALRRKATSAYRVAERKYTDPDELWEWLQANKHTDPTVCIGWAIHYAARIYNLNQVDVADSTAVYDSDGTLLVEPIQKQFISGMLSGHSKVSPQVYRRLAIACGVNPAHFYIAEGWLTQDEISALGRADVVGFPIVERINKLPEDQRQNAQTVMLEVLRTIEVALDVRTKTPVATQNKRSPSA